ncbi:DJ-1/PfpI family protein [Bengtsoniella intestinalis]|uniref:DJ-1/PfpI family protein n=1 Tax=Bengtsoniella intestinalis TaxID=3073143 RepID=UPI00391F31CE
MVYVFLTTGFELVEAMAPVDVMRRAGMDVTTVSITGDLQVESASKVTVRAEMLVEDCDFDGEMLLLPGGAGTKGYLQCQLLLDAVVAQYKAGKWIAAICAAPSILANIGIHVKSTVYPTMAEEIVDYTTAPVWVDGNVITANAVGSAMDFALEVVAQVKDKATAQAVAEKMYYTW